MPYPGWTKLRQIEERHGSIRRAVFELYGRHNSLKAVAAGLGITRPTLYRYLGKEELAVLKTQAQLQRLADQREISVGI
jgi:AcrR family transcriptional regulator